MLYPKTMSELLKPWTYDRYRALPDDRNRYEVIDGELHVTPAPTSWHQTVSRRLQFALYERYEKRGLGQVFNAPIDVILDVRNVVQPDIALVLNESATARIVRRGIEGPPDLVVEVLSPSTRQRDERTKRHVYADFGVREYWLADPKEATVIVATGDKLAATTTYRVGDELQSPVLPDLRLALAPVFRDIPRED